MKYLVFCDKNNSLFESSLELLKLLNIDFSDSCVFETYGGYLSYVANPDLFLISNAFNIAQAKKLNCALLVLDASSYEDILFAKNKIDENENILNSINLELKKHDLEYSKDTKIINLVDLLLEDNVFNNLKSKILITFESNFSTSIFKLHKNTHILLDLLKINVVHSDENTFFQYEFFNEFLAHKYSSMSFELALDSGSDFITTMSFGVFNIFDKKRKTLSKIANRDLGNMPVFFLPQLILLSMGIKDKNILAFKRHKFLPDFLC